MSITAARYPFISEIGAGVIVTWEVATVGSLTGLMLDVGRKASVGDRDPIKDWQSWPISPLAIKLIPRGCLRWMLSVKSLACIRCTLLAGRWDFPHRQGLRLLHPE